MLRWLTLPLLLVWAGAGEKKADGLDGTLWVQTSAEYTQAARQTYRAATARLEALLADNSLSAAPEQQGDFHTLPPAIVMDVDETVLDNSAFQARMLVDGTSYTPETWAAWVAKQEAGEVPGAKAFVTRARELGIAVIYVTNRECAAADCPQESDTVANLKKLGFPDVSAETVLLKHERPDWVSEKASRRVFLAERYRILMLVGDELGDFVSGAKGKGVTPELRRNLAEKYADWWGERWFLLPNPLYGSWLTTIGDKWSALAPYRD